MIHTPSTIGLLLLFALVFVVALLWATHGHADETGKEEEEIRKPGRTS